MLKLGIDLGGSKISVVVLDDSHSVRYANRMPTPRNGYDDVVKAIIDQVHEAESEVGETCTIGLGCPGAVSLTTGNMMNANSVYLNGHAFQQDLQGQLERKIRVANDANCFALSEAVDGAGQDAEVVFGVIVGSGVGGGLVVSGKVVVGINRIAGEWGHNQLPAIGPQDRPLPVCYCGRDGCIETYLSGPGLTLDYHRTTGQTQNVPRIEELAREGNPSAVAVLDRYFDRLARSLAAVINIVDPDVIVLGGGLSNVAALYDEVPKLWARYVFADEIRTRLVRNVHGDDSGVRGAAWLW